MEKTIADEFNKLLAEGKSINEAAGLILKTSDDWMHTINIILKLIN